LGHILSTFRTLEIAERNAEIRPTTAEGVMARYDAIADQISGTGRYDIGSMPLEGVHGSRDHSLAVDEVDE
jgi:hypothetical protein